MRPMIRLACGLAAGTVLLLTFASVAFAADPLLTIDGSGGTSSDGSADATVVANLGTSQASVTLGADAPATISDDADGSSTVTIGAGAPATTADDVNGDVAVTLGALAPAATADAVDGSASVSFGAGYPAATDGDIDATGTVTLGAGAPTSDDGADGSSTVTLGAGAPTTVDDPATTVDALSSGFASLMAFGGSAAEDTSGDVPGNVPGTSAIDGAVPAMSSIFGLLAFGGTGVTPSDPGGSGGSGAAATAPSETGGGALPETSTEALASGLGVGFPMLALVLGLLAGGLVARRRSVTSAS